MASRTASLNASGVRPSRSNWWRQLTEPSAKLTDLQERRQAQLLSIMTLTFMIVGIGLMVLLPVVSPSANSTNIPILISLLFFLVPYGISRTEHFRVGSILLLILTTITLIVPVYTNGTEAPSVIPLLFLSLVIILASLLLGRREVIMVAGLIIILLVGVESSIQLSTGVSAPIFLVIMSSVLLLVSMTNRDALEKDRQYELQTALKLAEASVEAELRSNHELDTKNQELVRANALIKESTRLKSEFLSTMSHELRTPLNAIRGFTGILLEGMGGEIDEEARHMLTRVDANSARLLGLINDVLDIAKIEAGRMELLSEPLNPYDLVEQWQAQMSVLAEQKGLEFEVTVDPHLPEIVIGDGQRITQIATNLLSNAFKFTKQGKVNLSVSTEGDNWLIRVKDTGMGIPPHALNYIFEEFRQVDGSSKREFGGTGLGLAISRTIARTMGGNISVRSELGVGSEFTVVLPLDGQAKASSALPETQLA